MIRTTLALFLALLMVGTSVLKAQPTGSVLIKNATVLTITNGTLEKTDVYIKDGKIEEVGKDLSAPRQVTTIDATGKYVMPGIVDAHSHLAAVDVNEWTHPVTSEVTMEESINPNDVGIYHALAGGVTSTHLMHGSANVIGGQNETLKLRYGLGMDDLRFEGAPRTIKFALGENPTRVHGQGFGVQPRSRMGVEQVIRRTFDRALDYKRKREAYLESKKEYDNSRRKRGAPPVPVAKNLRLEVIADVLDGDILVHCHSYRADEILMLMRVFEDYGIENYTFQHANEAYKIAPELARHGAYTSVFSDWWAYKFEVYYSTAYNATILNENGVVNSINSDSDELIRHLNHEAAKVMHYGGTSPEDALKMITINPAKQLGIEDRVGSIEAGKDGDVAIWSGNPLSYKSICERTIIDGVTYFDREADPDDVRIDIEPEDGYDRQPGLTTHGRHSDACLRGVRHLLHEESTGGK